MARVNSYTQVMPTPERTSVDAIVKAASDLLELHGLALLSMQAVAERVGVRAPSLYKRVRNRDELVRLVAESSLVNLAHRLSEADDVFELAAAFRTFSHEHPAAFQLIMTPGVGVAVARPEFGEAAAGPVLRVAERLSGPEHALEAARTITAWASGFISMELNGGFNLGGSVDDAWRFGLTSIVRAISVAD